MVGKTRPAYNDRVGHTVRAPSGEIVVIKTQSSFWVRENGLSQGYPQDQGWVLELAGRPASVNEQSAFIAREDRGRNW